MPDSRMPHDNTPAGGRHDEPRNWSDAFAALPLETPPRDAWAKVAAQLGSNARPARHHRPLWMALAAAVALAIALPMAWLPRNNDAPRVDTQPIAVDRLANEGDAASPAPAPDSLSPARGEDGNGERASATGASAVASASKPPSRPGPLPRERGRGSRSATPASATSGDDTALASLYAQSAQLENLIAQVGDERMSSGPAAALSDQLETRVALIDASLADPALDDTQRSGLWRERVDTLQQLAGFQSTQLLLSASGENYDGQLVAVY